MGHGLDDAGAKPFVELHHTLLMAGRTKMAPFARECQQVLMAAIRAARPGNRTEQPHVFSYCRWIQRAAEGTPALLTRNSMYQPGGAMVWSFVTVTSTMPLP